MKKIVSCIAAFAMASTMVIAVPGMSFASSGDVLTISNAKQLAQFRDEVNAGNSYAGTEVRVTGGIGLDDYANWEPIGTPEHPFEGTFTGYNTSTDEETMRTISDMKVTGSSFLGLFGYVGDGGSIRNITLESATVKATSSTGVIKCVGTLAGYVYGTPGESSVYNCWVTNGDEDDQVASSVSVTNTMVVDEEKIIMSDTDEKARPEADVVAGYTEDGCVVKYIGGVVGYCASSIEGCVNKAAVNVTAQQAPDMSYSALAKCVGGVVGQCGGYLITEDAPTKGLCFKPCYPTADEGETYAIQGVIADITDCRNRGTITTSVDASAGFDRFGVEVTASLKNVGGIVGYAIANISGCANFGDLNTPTASGTGGIVGVFRGIEYTGPSSVNDSDPGCYKDGDTRLEGPEITVADCLNDATITVRSNGGGILGSGGTYTTVKNCANISDGSKILTGMRWNKPTTGGVVGQTYGNVEYCYSTQDVISDTGSGYYMSCLVGQTTRYLIDDGCGLDSPTPKIVGCYSTGTVLGGELAQSYKAASVCGTNMGLILDCYTTSDVDAWAENYGGSKNDENVKVNVPDSDLASKAYVARLNASVSYEDFCAGNYYVLSANAESCKYPVLAGEKWRTCSWLSQGSGVFNDSPEVIDEASLELGEASAVYSASANPLPTIAATYNGNTLVQNADYFTVPDTSYSNDNLPDADTVCSGAIIGMGDYSTNGEATAKKASYTIQKCDFSTCVATIASKTYNFEAQKPNKETDVVITDAGGNVVPQDEYTMEVAEEGYTNYKKQIINGMTVEGYAITFKAAADSNYEGNVTGYFKISKASITDCNLEFTYNDTTYKWIPGEVKTGTDGYLQSFDKNGNEVKGLTAPYTGKSIQPKLTKITYAGKNGDGNEYSLTANKDYKVVYGDPGFSADVISEEPANANTNVTQDDVVGKRAFITVRYYNQSNSCNWDNYVHIQFSIVPAPLSTCTVTMAASRTYSTTNPVVTVKTKAGVKVASSNYTVTMSNKLPGRRAVVIKGKGKLTGSVTKYINVIPSKVKKVTKATVGKKKMTVTWSKVAGSVGYQISYRQYGTSKWKSVTTVKNTRTIKYLKKGKRYQVKVRAYKTINGVKKYGSYSPIKLTNKIK